MAARKPRKAARVPVTAEEKAARKAMSTAQQLGVEQSKARQVASSKGAFRQRSLRAGGTEMQRYDLQRFKSDPFPSIPVSPPGGYSRGAAGPSAPTSPKPRPKPAPKGKPTGKREVGSDLTPGKPTKKPKGTISNPGAGQLPQERRAEELAKKKAEEARKAAERKKATQQNKDKGTYRAPKGGGSVAM